MQVLLEKDSVTLEQPGLPIIDAGGVEPNGLIERSVTSHRAVPGCKPGTCNFATAGVRAPSDWTQAQLCRALAG
jgi:hypothetical protein